MKKLETKNNISKALSSPLSHRRSLRITSEVNRKGIRIGRVDQFELSPDCKFVLTYTENKYELSKIVELTGQLVKTMFNAKDKGSVFMFLDNHYFAILSKDSKRFDIHRTKDGSIFCTLDRSIFSFVYGTNFKKKNTPVTGILDKRSNKIYPWAIKSLLHVGANILNLYLDDF
jgi:hypothetical protein